VRYLEALQRVAAGYREPIRHVRADNDRSVGLYPIFRKDKKKKHDSLKERCKHFRRVLRGNPLNASARASLNFYQTELDARRAGNPTEGFEV